MIDKAGVMYDSFCLLWDLPCGYKVISVSQKNILSHVHTHMDMQGTSWIRRGFF